MIAFVRKHYTVIVTLLALIILCLEAVAVVLELSGGVLPQLPGSYHLVVILLLFGFVLIGGLWSYRLSQQTRLQALYAEENPSPVLRLATDGTILYKNTAAAIFLAGLPDHTVLVEAAAKASATGKETRREVTSANSVFTLSFVPVVLPGGTTSVNVYGMDVTAMNYVVEAFRENENHLRAIINHMPLLIYEMDPDGKITFSDGAGLQTLGLTQADILGKSAFDLFPDYPDALDVMRRSLGGELTRGVIELGPVTFFTAYNPIMDDDGKIRSIVGASLDISEQRRTELNLQETSLRLKTLIESLQFGVLVEDECHQIALVNQGFCDLFGLSLTPDAMTGMDCTQIMMNSARGALLNPDDAIATIERRIAESVPVSGDIMLLKDGRVFERDYVPIALPRLASQPSDGEPYTGHLWLYREITERRHAEIALAEARDEALAASRLKSQFLATMSHEIRTPMNGIIGMSELLMETELDGEQQEFAEIVRGEAMHLLGIINNILDYSKIEAGQLALEMDDFQPRLIMDTVTNHISTRISEKGLTLYASVAPDVPDLLHGDGERLRQVIMHLADNAVKFTNKGSVTLQMLMTATGEDWIELRICVYDTGIGLSPVARERLYDPFVQADGSVTRRYGGMGLGLVIVRRLVELMGGEIKVESEEGKGANFAFTAQFSPVRDDASSDTPSPMPELRGHILVAEDSHMNQEVTRKQLRRLGYRAHIVENGQQAVAALHAADQRYDLVLMDCHMPVMDGYEAAATIRATETASGAARIPVVAMTADDAPGTRQRCASAGMDDFISKPVMLDRLRSVLERWLAAGV